MLNEDKFLHISPGENKAPLSLLFDAYAEELSFPTIYGGQFRTFREGINVTPFMQATGSSGVQINVTLIPNIYYMWLLKS